jgi:hypothetical protein
MADFKISGRMSVERLQKQFKDNFGSSLRVYKGAVFADPKATLASIRTSDDKGGEFLVRGNMHVGTFEDDMLKRFGIRVQVSSADDSKLLPNDMTLAASGKALSKASKTNRSAGNASGSGEAASLNGLDRKEGISDDKVLILGDSAKQVLFNEFYHSVANRDYHEGMVVKQFMKRADDIFKSIDVTLEEDRELVMDLEERMRNLIHENGDVYGGIAYLLYVAGMKYGHNMEFDEEVIFDHGYTFQEFLQQELSPVGMVCANFDKDDFEEVFISKFIFSLIRLIDYDCDVSDLAEYIVACGVKEYTFSDEQEDWINDIAVGILSALGFELETYEGDCSLSTNRFLMWQGYYFGLDMGYDYLRLADDLKNSGINVIDSEFYSHRI